MNVEAIIDKVIQSMTTKTVIGEPMEVGSLTLIPILNVSFGFGAGGGEAKAAVDDGGSGTGAGGGARMKVAGVLVIKGDDVQFVQTGADGRRRSRRPVRSGGGASRRRRIPRWIRQRRP